MRKIVNLILEKIKLFLKNILIYVVIAVCAGASFFIGVYFQKNNTEIIKHEIKRMNKKDILLAIDENNNLILINKNSGDYTIYEDSIGENIFKIYANNVWNQNK